MEVSKTPRIQRKLQRLYNELFWLRRRYSLMGDKDAVEKIDAVRQLIIRHLDDTEWEI